MEYNLYIRFILKKNKVNNEGKAPINIRFTLNGKRAELSTNKYIEIDKWDSKTNKLKGNKEGIRILNNYLDNTKTRVNRIFNLLVESNKDFTLDDLKNEITGNSKKTKTLLEFFDYHISDLTSKINRGYALNTIKKYNTARNKLKSFIKKNYNKNDVLLKDLNFSFISEFESYIKTEHKCGHNTAIKNIKQLKAVVHRAIDHELIDKDPFTKYKCSFEETNRGFLTQEELDKLQNKTIKVHHLEKVKDMFLFGCMTGISYADLEKLTPDNIVIGIDKNKWIQVYRTKTNTRSSIPLLPKALELIEKYSDYPESVSKGKLLPMYTNQTTNKYLKKVAKECAINKRLTFHMSRHTFATTITLSNGVPITSVSAMLGHRKISTTQIYSKVVDTTVAKEMTELQEKLSSQADNADEDNKATG